MYCICYNTRIFMCFLVNSVFFLAVADEITMVDELIPISFLLLCTQVQIVIRWQSLSVLLWGYSPQSYCNLNRNFR